MILFIIHFLILYIYREKKKLYIYRKKLLMELFKDFPFSFARDDHLHSITVYKIQKQGNHFILPHLKIYVT